MKKILIWVGIVALSLQDYFKKQPIKPTRQQQFFQTGATSQAFIAGQKSVFTTAKKILTKYLSSPILGGKGYVEYTKKIGSREIRIWMYLGGGNWVTVNIYTIFDGILKREENLYHPNSKMQDFDIFFEKVISEIFKSYYIVTENEDYLNLEGIAAAGDWELALQIAKGQGLL